jgi:hypothetical protein
VAWKSSDVKVATINASGLATGVSAGTTTITAIGTASSGAIITATSNLKEDVAGPVNLPTLTVYKVGSGTGTVTAPAPGTQSPNVINRGPAAGCVGNFTLGASVVLTAAPVTGSTFGGWSANCTPVIPMVNNQPQCTITMNNNDTVGAIFNTPVN